MLITAIGALVGVLVGSIMSEVPLAHPQYSTSPPNQPTQSHICRPATDQFTVGGEHRQVKGRKPAFIIGFTGAGVAVMLLNVHSSSHLILLMACLIRMFTGIYEAVWYTYTPEADTTNPLCG